MGSFIPCVARATACLEHDLAWNACPQPGVAMRAPGCVQVPGVAGYFGHKDVPGTNKIGPVVADEEVYASEVVTAVGQVSRWLWQQALAPLAAGCIGVIGCK